jgi:hypothetical protein
MADETVTHFAKSAYSDLTNWVGLIQAILALVLSDSDIAAAVGPMWMSKLMLISGILTIVARTFNAQRPVANVFPGNTKPVEVAKLHEKPAA